MNNNELNVPVELIDINTSKLLTAKKHNEVIYPTVRVICFDAGGSGTVVFSKKNGNGNVETYIITNYHVVESAISIEEKWVASLGKKVDKELKRTVRVETFKYIKFSRHVGGTSIEADIVAYDQDEDIALLKTRDTENIVMHVANIFPISDIDNIFITDVIYNVGATHNHPPFSTIGEIAFMDDEIDNYNYWMVTAACSFGSSGGATMRWDSKRYRWEYIGMPSIGECAIDGINLLSHMGYIIPIDRIYRFLNENNYQFIHDDSIDILKCHEEREKIKKIARGKQ